MSSQAPSLTQASENTSSTLSSPSDPSSPTFSSYKDMTGKKILEDMRQLRSQGIHYAGDKIDSSRYDFVYNKTVRGDVLVPKENNRDLSEFILAGVFEVDGRNFFMTSDGKWTSENAVKSQFHQVKPSCLLLPVRRHPEFAFSANDYPSIVENIRAIESSTNPRKSKEDASILVNDSGVSPAIKVIHHLFIDNKVSENTSDRDEEFTINNWPVPLSNEYYLDELKDTHSIRRLPAYDIRGNLIHPLDYEEKLAGAIVRACFTIIHYVIKQKHVFNAALRDITVLRAPTSIPASNTSLKRILHPKIHVHV